MRILLLEEVERAIQILGEDPPLNPLIGSFRITPANTSIHEKELNGSQKFPPEEIVDQENPILMSPHEVSSMTSTTQQRSERVSSGMGIPIVLIDLITIYDDEEGL
jgi:hypothetical protein